VYDAEADSSESIHPLNEPLSTRTDPASTDCSKAKLSSEQTEANPSALSFIPSSLHKFFLKPDFTERYFEYRTLSTKARLWATLTAPGEIRF